MKFFNYFFIIVFVFLCVGISFAACVDYDGDGVADACGQGGSVPMPTGIERVGTGTTSGQSSSSQSYIPAPTVSRPSGPSMESIAATTIAGGILGGLFSEIFSSSPEPTGPTPAQIEAQRQNEERRRQLEEKKRQEFLQSKARLSGKLRGPGTTYAESKNITTTGGLKLKSISFPVEPAGSSSGDVHSGFFGQSGAVRLFREPMNGPPESGLLDWAEYQKLISNPNLTQEERERLFIRTKVPAENLTYTNWVDPNAWKQREPDCDIYLDITKAMVKGGAGSFGVFLTEEGGKKFLKIKMGKDTGYDKLLFFANAGIEPPKNAVDTATLIGEYAMTKAPGWTIIVVKSVGSGTRQAIVRYWASQNKYDYRPIEISQEEWNSWYVNQNKCTRAALDFVGAGEF